MTHFALFDGALQVFDVDHGQCALLTMPGHAGTTYRVLIDCGHAVNFRGAAWYPGAHLRALGVTYIDLLVCTNYDEDHMSGFPDLANRGIGIGCILGNPTVAPETLVKLKIEDGMGKGINAVAHTLAIRKNMVWPQIPPIIPKVSMTCSWNPYPYFDDENNLSLVLTLDVHGFRFMFPGDMESRGWNNLLATCPRFRSVVSGVNILIAAHHGRLSGICEQMFDAYNCNPNLVIISDDYKRHDTQETVAYYGTKAIGISDYRGQAGVRKVLTTRTDGEIRFSFVNGRCAVC